MDWWIDGQIAASCPILRPLGTESSPHTTPHPSPSLSTYHGVWLRACRRVVWGERHVWWASVGAWSSWKGRRRRASAPSLSRSRMEVAGRDRCSRQTASGAASGGGPEAGLAGTFVRATWQGEVKLIRLIRANVVISTVITIHTIQGLWIKREKERKNLLLVSAWRRRAVWGTVPLHVFLHRGFGVRLWRVHVSQRGPGCWGRDHLHHSLLTRRLPGHARHKREKFDQLNIKLL